MSDFRVSKLEAPATLYLSNASLVRGTVFLAEFSATHSGHETVLDLMRDPDPMLPMLDLAGRFLLIGRHHIVAVEVESDVAGAEDLTVTVPAEIDTTGGHILNGELHMAAGMGERISDALNGHFDWHALRSGSVVTWISRQHIIKAKTDG